MAFERGPSKRVLGGLIAAALTPGRARGASGGAAGASYGAVLKNLLAALVPVALVAAMFLAGWWYVIVHNAPKTTAPVVSVAPAEAPAPGVIEPPPADALAEPPSTDGLAEPPASGEGDAMPEALGGDSESPDTSSALIGSDLAESTADSSAGQTPEQFYPWFWGLALLSALLLTFYYLRMDGEQLEILKMLEASVVPLGLLTFIVLAVILFGITTATESAAVGALGALYLAGYAKYPRQTLWWSVVGLIVGLALGLRRGDVATIIVSSSLGGLFAGAGVPWISDLLSRRRKLLSNIKESTFLTAKTTAMVCWLFVGSGLFSAVFALHGGQQLIEHWVLSMELSSLQFLMLSQAIIFLLGWPLEWTEIIVIFVPIFIPLLAHFNVDPVLFGTMVAVNLQAAFLSPPVAMSAFYLKGVAPKHVTLNQIFAGMMPYMLIVILCLAIMYVWPGMALWLPNFLYGAG
jgi:TRAP-type mannitol/chloroaromatic compound transport system permease large subunit